MIGVLFQNDIKYLKKDPTMWVLGCVPLIFAIVYQWGVLRLEVLEPFLAPIQYLFIIISSCIGGVLWGLRMLDDKDEHMLDFYAVSPIGLKGYLHYKVGIALLYSMIAMSIVVLTIGRKLESKLLFILNAACLGPLVNLIIFSLATNKIQGMGYAKAIGMTILLPLTGLIRENFFTPLIKLLPTYGLYDHLCLGEFSTGVYFFYIVGTVVMIYLLYEHQLG